MCTGLKSSHPGLKIQITFSRHVHMHFLNGKYFYHLSCTEGTSLPPVRQLCGGSYSAIEHMLKFGRELQCFYDKITRDNGKNETNANALRVRIDQSCVEKLNFIITSRSSSPHPFKGYLCLRFLIKSWI